MPSKTKTNYLCHECGETFSKWQGQCSACKEWNTIKEFKISTPKKQSHANQSFYAGFSGSATSILQNKPQKISEINLQSNQRINSGIEEFDRVLGGGIVTASVSLVGGAPGVGKSSILIQVLAILSQKYKCLYVSGEESLAQIAQRAIRMKLDYDNLFLVANTDVEQICAYAEQEKPDFMVIDSIQTMSLVDNSGATGSITQVRDSAQYLTRFAKQSGVSIFLVGHVTKSGEVAGPKILEHMVDTVVYLESSDNNKYRTMRSVKNRYGQVNELGVFYMAETGMKQVKNPSAIFLNRDAQTTSGTIVVVIWEGTRPLLVEMQTLVSQAVGNNLRRVSLGFDSNRLAMLLAVMSKKANLTLISQDVYLNIVGGVKITETAADLSCVLAIFSSYQDLKIADEVIAFGEVGLGGEVRPVPNGVERIKEASKHGFTIAIVPSKNKPSEAITYRNKTMQVIGVNNIAEAIQQLQKL